MNYIDALALLGNAKRAEGTQVRHAGNASYTKVEVVCDSEDGVAVVNPGGMVLSSDDSQYIEVETIGAVSEGDMADALLVGDDNSGKTLLLVGSVGSGDKLNLRIAAIEADYIKTEQLEAATARIGDLEADHVSVSDFEAEQANIDTLQASTADIDTIRANAAKVANLTAAELEADHATVGALDATYAQINLANVDNAWIQNGTVKDGAITNAMINSVSANKLTAGTIDASAITVTNLNAGNITTGTINGQRIGEGSLSLSKLEDDVYTETEVDGIVQNLQSQIDGAIETWTGADVPTLQNAPAVNWDTDSIKDTHVGDVYFVVNSQSQQNGYNYRFTKTGNVYSWQLIKDNDVTNALRRLTDAEGRIGTIETFDTTVSSFMTNTDAELTSIKTAATTLEGRVDTAEGTLATKVDTSTFNTLSQTVGENTSSITNLTETVTTAITTVSNTVNTVSQTADSNSAKITNLTTVLGTNADGTTSSTDIVHRTSAIEQDLSGFKTTVSETYSTKTETSSIESRVSTAESSITQNAENIELKVSKDGVISSINQSSESVKIRASKIEIDGTAIFTNEDFREAADAAYASKASEALIESANTNANNALQTALDGAFLVLTSTNGQLFKNGTESTILQVAIFPNGGTRCDTIEQVRSRFGSTAYIEWKWMHESSGEWGTLISTDPHLSRGGMWLTVSPEDVATKTTFAASLVVPD